MPPHMKARDVIKVLERNGWVYDHSAGGHRMYFKKGFKPVPVPFRTNQEIGADVIKIIEKQTGVSLIKRNQKKRRGE